MGLSIREKKTRSIPGSVVDNGLLSQRIIFQKEI